MSAQCLTPAIPPLERLRQEDDDFEALGAVSGCPGYQTNAQTKMIATVFYYLFKFYIYFILHL